MWSKDLIIRDRPIVVFWDYMSLFQNEAPWPESGKKEDHSDSRTPEQKASFDTDRGHVRPEVLEGPDPA